MVLSAEVLRQYLKKFGSRIGNMLKTKGETMRQWLGKKKEISMEEFLSACRDIMSGSEERNQLEGVFQCLQYNGKLNVEDFEDVLSSHGAIAQAQYSLPSSSSHSNSSRKQSSSEEEEYGSDYSSEGSHRSF